MFTIILKTNFIFCAELVEIRPPSGNGRGRKHKKKERRGRGRRAGGPCVQE